MLDTIILQLDVNKFSIIDYSKFGTTKEIVEKSFGFKKWINNPTAKDKKNDVYKPRLTLIVRGVVLYLKIEFSAPKIIYKNNLDELKEKDFELLIALLRKKIQDMGVLILSKSLETAEVLSFHPSKNIQLSKNYTSNLAIKWLKKVDLPMNFDLDEKEYRNGGETLQFYTRSHAFVIYDKINDITKPLKRATDKDQTKTQTSLYDFLKTQRTEILRLEIRLCTRKKMNEILEKINHAPNPLFIDVFKQDLCQKIVILYWEKFFKNKRFIFNIKSTPQEVAQLILLKYPTIKMHRLLKLIGLYLTCRDEEGIRGFRQISGNYRPKNGWESTKRDLKIFEDKVFTNPVWYFIKEIEKELKSFKPFNLSNSA